MGILKPKKQSVAQTTSLSAKRRSVQETVSNLKPLKPGAGLNFTGIRDSGGAATKDSTSKDEDDMESDEEDRKVPSKNEKDNDDNDDVNAMSPEDIKRQGELSTGVSKMKASMHDLFCL